ncbi:hypothetical protein [Cellulomonas sp. S1-8]|uniref:hypothetical protein n=1 Tax=Cellulomonas sp. S1-8 TaxID=2904790 RepID=UPI002244E2B6|nr:hypothetical protein [Cellulomonas sp. S1-8]UZN03863.1 hypothetical protein OKX07_02670 [Cellulomonas sp. S1-8]
MAGGVFVSEESYWGVNSWVFSWAVETLAERVASVPLAEQLREIEEHHLGSFALAQFPPEQRSELVAQIRLLPQVAEDTLDESEGRPHVIAWLQELADMVTAAEA